MNTISEFFFYFLFDPSDILLLAFLSVFILTFSMFFIRYFAGKSFFKNLFSAVAVAVSLFFFFFSSTTVVNRNKELIANAVVVGERAEEPAHYKVSRSAKSWSTSYPVVWVPDKKTYIIKSELRGTVFYKEVSDKTALKYLQNIALTEVNYE